MDYGARWYDGAIGRFTTTDRFAEKYYPLSPYGYAAGNPVLFIDVNGDSLWINYSGNNILYQDGKLYGSDGNEYTGKGAKVKKDGTIKYKGFLGKAVKALGMVSESTVGQELISGLQNSPYNITIGQSEINQYLPDDHESYGINIITNNTYAVQVLEDGQLLAKHLPFNSIGDGGSIRWTGNNFIELAHELAHASDGANGLLTTKRATVNGKLEEIREIRAVYIANRIRQHFGQKLRESYNPGGARLLDANGNPINYPLSIPKK